MSTGFRHLDCPECGYECVIPTEWANAYCGSCGTRLLPEPGEPDHRKVLVHVSRGGLDIGDRLVAKSLNATNDDYDFTVERAVWRAQRAGNTFTEEDIING